MIFKIDKSSFITTPLFMNGVVILLELIYTVNVVVTFIILLCFNWGYFNTYLRKYLSEIEINTDLNTCSLTYINDFTLQTKEEYPTSELKCNFETVTKARGVQVEVFRIFFKDLIIVEIKPSIGWSKDVCFRIQKELTPSGSRSRSVLDE